MSSPSEHFEVEGVERVGALGLSSPVSLEFFYVGKKSGRPLKILPHIPSHSRYLFNVVTKKLNGCLFHFEPCVRYIIGLHLIS